MCARLRSVWRNRARRYYHAMTAFFSWMRESNGCFFSNMPIASIYLIIHSNHARRADKNVYYFSTKCGSGSSPPVRRTFEIECPSAGVQIQQRHMLPVISEKSRDDHRRNVKKSEDSEHDAYTSHAEVPC